MRGSDAGDSGDGEEGAAGTNCGEGGNGISVGSIRRIVDGVAFW